MNPRPSVIPFFAHFFHGVLGFGNLVTRGVATRPTPRPSGSRSRAATGSEFDHVEREESSGEPRTRAKTGRRLEPLSETPACRRPRSRRSSMQRRSPSYPRTSERVRRVTRLAGRLLTGLRASTEHGVESRNEQRTGARRGALAGIGALVLL